MADTDSLERIRKALTDERILHFRDTHVGTPTARHPLKDDDWINFARVVELNLCAGFDADLRSLLAREAALRESLARLERALDWHLGRSGFTQRATLQGVEHGAAVRKELYAAHDAARAALASTEPT